MRLRSAVPVVFVSLSLLLVACSSSDDASSSPTTVSTVTTTGITAETSFGSTSTASTSTPDSSTATPAAESFESGWTLVDISAHPDFLGRVAINDLGGVAISASSATDLGADGTPQFDPLVLYSTDLTSWGEIAVPAFVDATIVDVVANSTVFIAVGMGCSPESGVCVPTLWRSTDGATWTMAAAGESFIDIDVDYADRLDLTASDEGFVLTGITDDIMQWSSPNGVEWTEVTFEGAPHDYPDDGGWVATAGYGAAITSRGHIQTGERCTDDQVDGVMTGGMVCGAFLWQSSDSASWVREVSDAAPLLEAGYYGLAESSDAVVAVGIQPGCLREARHFVPGFNDAAPDPAWPTFSAPPSDEGDSGAVALHSVDGVTWTEAGMEGAEGYSNIRGVFHTADGFVALATHGTDNHPILWHSADGTTWIVVDTPPDFNHTAWMFADSTDESVVLSGTGRLIVWRHAN